MQIEFSLNAGISGHNRVAWLAVVTASSKLMLHPCRSEYLIKAPVSKLDMKSSLPKRVKRHSKKNGFWGSALPKYLNMLMYTHIWRVLFQNIIYKLENYDLKPFFKWRLRLFGKELFIYRIKSRQSLWLRNYRGFIPHRAKLTNYQLNGIIAFRTR